MIGVKNPSQNIGETLSAEVWFNELRLSEIDGKGGWSALAAIGCKFCRFCKYFSFRKNVYNWIWIN